MIESSRRILAVSAILVGLVGCDDLSEQRTSSAARGGCVIAPTLVATLGSLDDPASLPSNWGFSVEVQSLRNGGWLAIGGIPYLPAPLRYGPSGDFLGEVGRAGDGPNEFSSPWGLARGPGDSIWVTDHSYRIVILDPDAMPTRTIPADTSFGVIEGFTPNATPYGAAGRNSTELDTYFPLIRLYSLDGGPTRLLGPGHTNPAADWYLLSIARSRVMMDSDSTALAAFGPAEGEPTTDDPVWVSRWTPSGEAELVMKSEILEQLKNRFPNVSSDRLYHIALSPRSDGRILSLAGVAQHPVGETDRPNFYGLPAGEANSAFDGLIMLLDGSEVLAVGRTPDVPVGFSGESQVFSLVEDSLTGLVSANVWDLDLSECPVG